MGHLERRWKTFSIPNTQKLRIVLMPSSVVIPFTIEFTSASIHLQLPQFIYTQLDPRILFSFQSRLAKYLIEKVSGCIHTLSVLPIYVIDESGSVAKKIEVLISGANATDSCVRLALTFGRLRRKFTKPSIGSVKVTANPAQVQLRQTVEVRGKYRKVERIKLGKRE